MSVTYHINLYPVFFSEDFDSFSLSVSRIYEFVLIWPMMWRWKFLTFLINLAFILCGKHLSFSKENVLLSDCWVGTRYQEQIIIVFNVFTTYTRSFKINKWTSSYVKSGGLVAMEVVEVCRTLSTWWTNLVAQCFISLSLSVSVTMPSKLQCQTGGRPGPPNERLRPVQLSTDLTLIWARALTNNKVTGGEPGC